MTAVKVPGSIPLYMPNFAINTVDESTLLERAESEISEPYLTDVLNKKTQHKSFQNRDKLLSQNADVMEHYKKRLIHQIEKPEKAVELSNEISQTSHDDDTTISKEKENVCQSGLLPGTKSESQSLSGEVGQKTEESETSSPPGCPSTAGVDKKKEVIQKIARRKSVSRSHFRHDNIPVYKLGSSIHDLKKNILLNVNTEKKPEKNVPKETLTADIIQAMDGNKSPLGRHNLPTILSSEDLRKQIEPSEKKNYSSKVKLLENTKNEQNGKTEKKHEHRRKDKKDKTHHRYKKKIDKKKSRSPIKPIKIRLDKSEKQQTESKKQTTNGSTNKLETTEISDVSNKISDERLKYRDQFSDKNEKGNSKHLADESHPVNSSKGSIERELTPVKDDDHDVIIQNPSQRQTPTIESSRLENLLKENMLQTVHSKSSKETSSISSSPKPIILEPLDTSRADNSNEMDHTSSTLNLEMKNSKGFDTPVINIQSMSDDKGLKENNVIQIRIAPTSPSNEIGNHKPEIDDAYLESLLSLVKSTMQPTKLCIALLGILNFYYRDLSQRLATNSSIQYKVKIKQTLYEILLYVEKQLFGNNDKPELKKYTKQIMQSDLKEHKDFVEVHLHVLDKKCNDPLWMEKFIQTLTQSKQYTTMYNKIIMNTSNYSQKSPLDPNKTKLDLKGSTVQNPVIMKDYYNVNASAKVLDKLQKFQSNVTNTNSSLSNSIQTSANGYIRAPDSCRSPQKHSNQTFVVPSSVPNSLHNTQMAHPTREKRKYTKRRNSNQIPPEPVLLQHRSRYPDVFPSNVAPSLPYDPHNITRPNGHLPDANNIYSLANSKGFPPEYVNQLQNLRESFLSHMKTNNDIAINEKHHTESKKKLNQQFGIPPPGSSIPVSNSNGFSNDKCGSTFNSLPGQYGRYPDAKLLENNYSAFQNQMEMSLASSQKPPPPFGHFPPPPSTNKSGLTKVDQSNSMELDSWNRYRTMLNLNHYIHSGQITTNTKGLSPPNVTSSFSYNPRMYMPNVPVHDKNLAPGPIRKSPNGTIDQMKTIADPKSVNFDFRNNISNKMSQNNLTSRTVVSPKSGSQLESRIYAQKMLQGATNQTIDHFNGMQMPNIAQWTTPVGLEVNNFNRQIKGSSNQGIIHPPAEYAANGPIVGPFPMSRQISSLSENQENVSVNNSTTKQMNKISQTNVPSTSSPVSNLSAESIPYTELMERRIDKLKTNQYQPNSNISAHPNVIQNHRKTVHSNYSEPKDFSFRKISHLTSQNNLISNKTIIPEKLPTTAAKKLPSGSSFRVENLVFSKNNENSQHGESNNGMSPRDNSRPAIVSSFNFLQEIHSPPPTSGIHSPKTAVVSHNINNIDSYRPETANSFRKDDAITTPIDSRENKEIELDTATIRNGEKWTTETNNVVKKVILQDNSMQITREPMTQQSFKIEEQTDIVVVEKIKTDSYEMNEDKKRISHLHTNFGGFDRTKTMVDLLRSIRPDVYREVRRKTDLKIFGTNVMEVTEVITIDDDEETGTKVASSPESVTIEKIAETSEVVPKKRPRLIEDTSSDSIIITPDKPMELNTNNTPGTEIHCTNSSQYTSQSVDMRADHSRPNSPPTVEIPSDTTPTGYRPTQLELNTSNRLNHQIVEIESTDSESTNDIATDLSNNASKRSKLPPMNLRTLHIHYTTPRPITSPKIERQYSQSSISTISSSRLELPSPHSHFDHPTPPISGTLPGIEDVSDQTTQMMSDPCDRPQTNCPNGDDLDWARSSLGTIVSRRRSSGPLDLSLDEDQQSTVPYPPLNPAFRNAEVEDAQIKRQDLVTSPIRSDLTSVKSPTEYNSTKSWKSSFTEDQKKNFREFYKIRRHSVESRSSFSDTSSPIPVDDMATVTMGSASFHIKKSFLDYIPKGKLYYKKDTNTFVQCFVNDETKKLQIVKEPQLPQKWIFSSDADFNDAECFSKEFEKVQKFVPKDFSQYYRFVTGYQIFNHKRPISFQTFLEMHNGDRMDTFFVKYLAHLQKFTLSGVSNPEDWNVM